MADSSNFLQEVLTALEPFANAARADDGVSRLFAKLGWTTPAITGFPNDSIQSILHTVAELQDLIAAQKLPETLDEFQEFLGAIADTVEAIQALEALFGSSAPPNLAQLAGIVGDLLSSLAADYIRQRRPSLYAAGVLLTFIEERELAPRFDGAEMVRTPTTVPMLRLQRLVDLFGDPVGVLKAEYLLAGGLTNPDGTADRLFPRMAALLRSFGIESVYGLGPNHPRDYGAAGNQIADHTLIFRAPVVAAADAEGEVGAALFLDGDVGLVVIPFGRLTFTEVGKLWTTSITATLSVDGFAIGAAGLTVPNVGASIGIEIDAKRQRLIEAPAGTTPPPETSAGSSAGARLELGLVHLAANASFAGDNRKFGFLFDVDKASLVIDGGKDGFLSKIIPSPQKIDFALGIGWSNTAGLAFKGSAGLEVNVPVTLGVPGSIEVSGIRIRIAASTSPAAVTVTVGAQVSGQLGPVKASVDNLGLAAALDFAAPKKNLGIFDLGFDFKPPDGVGIAIKAGPVSGGGFIAFDKTAGRYFGALELSVYSIAIKAFGIIDTKLPDGNKGFSFLIIISAEFTPIQLGFGFTLNGVGGLAGINRTIDADALIATVRAGRMDHLLFPKDPIKDAPQIVHDLGAIFPPAEGHYVFGPLAKLGWGTPTLVEAKLGLILELPGPRLVLLGTIQARLPKPEAALVLLNLDVAGVLDFPKKSFSLDASLHDSRVGEFPVSGDMAMRLTWGNNPNFALAIGGFNKHFTPPSGFPALRRATIDLGQKDNPSIKLSGYLALTSNTAQLGAELEARVKRSGAELYGFIAFDAIFVFSPFSFMADIEGGVGVSFHGHGFNLHFHGHIQGPSPWRLDGQVCVSILFWDACVGFSVTIGSEQQATVPGLDPWVGSPAAEPLLAKQAVGGLRQALGTTANWTGGLPPAAFSVVSLVAAPEGAPTPVDPMGSVTLRQKAVPLTVPITKFAGTKPSVPRTFTVTSVTVGQGGQGPTTTVTNLPLVKDYFAPAQYIEMKDADKLSGPSFDLMPAGFTVSSDEIVPGTTVIKAFKYDTIVIKADGTRQELDQQYDPTATHVDAVAQRSAVALAGIRTSGLARFIDVTATPKGTLFDDLYGVADIGTLGKAAGFAVGVGRSAATAALLSAVATNPGLRKTLQVAPLFNTRTS